jgi:hypothetical protein
VLAVKYYQMQKITFTMREFAFDNTCLIYLQTPSWRHSQREIPNLERRSKISKIGDIRLHKTFHVVQQYIEGRFFLRRAADAPCIQQIQNKHRTC